MSQTKELVRLLSVSALVYAIYLAVACPCPTFLSCHTTEFNLALCVAQGAALLRVQ